MINLQKKQSINLAKAAPSINNIRVGLSWDDAQLNGQSPDCDVSIFMLGDNGKIPGEQFFVFYNNLVSGDGAVRHNGDNRSGVGEGDDETIDITLQSISPSIAQIIFTISINNSAVGFNFSSVANASVRVYNSSNNQIICQYKLAESFPNSDTLNIGRCYRSGNEWEFEAMGQDYTGGLETALALYGS
jgi:tellurium resistance protein TerD